MAIPLLAIALCLARLLTDNVVTNTRGSLVTALISAFIDTTAKGELNLYRFKEYLDVNVCKMILLKMAD